MFGRKSVLREKTEKEKKMEEKKGGGRGDRKVDVKDPSTLTGPEVCVVVVDLNPACMCALHVHRHTHTHTYAHIHTHTHTHTYTHQLCLTCAGMVTYPYTFLCSCCVLLHVC